MQQLYNSVFSNYFVRFSTIGLFGLLVDSVSFRVILWLTNQVLIARIFAFWLAATFTLLGNHLFTYQLEARQLSWSKSCRYMLICHFSGTLNLLIFWHSLGTFHLPFSFALGVLVGLLANYFFTKHFVFLNTSALLSNANTQRN